MGGKKKEKETVLAKEDKGKDLAKENGKGKDKPAGAGRRTTASGPEYRLPPPDRTCHVAAPPVRPPPLPNAATSAEDEDAAYFDAAPRKMQLEHIPLLQHPVSICAIDNFLSEEECRDWVDWGEQAGFEEAKQRQTAEFAHRDNGRIQVENAEIAQLLWLRIRPFVPETLVQPDGRGASRAALGCSPRIRLYRYSRGQCFGQHIDQSFDEPSLGGRTHFTVLVYLNGGDRESKAERRVQGGETTFWKDRGGKITTKALAFPPTRGVCLYHGHGDECMIHEGSPVESGTKYVLRTDVVYEKES